MDHLQFTHAISRLRVLETKLLDRSKIERMIDSSSAEEALKILGETEYSNYMSNIKRAEDYEILLGDELKRLYKLMYSISPEKSLIDIMAVRYDYHNIKVLLKDEKLNKDLSYLMIPVGTIDINNLKKMFKEDNYKELNEFMFESIKEANKMYEEEKDPQKIDIIVDAFMYKEMIYKSNIIDEEFLREYFKSSIDLTNIKTLLRVKKQNKSRKFLEDVLIDGGSIDIKEFLNYQLESIDNISNKLSYTPYEKIVKMGFDEYNKTGNISYFEKLSEDYIMDKVKKGKYISFGVEPLIGYIFAKETEIKIIRIIMVGKLNNIDPQIIRERLRDVYV
ncbi:V-type ATP synthase subunit C [Clostridium rectalis]|uniref:V-type ATP synthase subunit C n=1 Tax=Clostridium rectalis TaxID=2040295 RepID=UPI000F62FA6B|nr:V-type ATP synthase subunit C [Clostridium rectalis]